MGDTGLLVRTAPTTATRRRWWSRPAWPWTFAAVTTAALALTLAAPLAEPGPPSVAPWSGAQPMTSVDGMRVHSAAWSLTRLPLDRRTWLEADGYGPSGPMALDGSSLFVDDRGSWFHPGGTASAGLQALGDYRQARDPRLLAAARRITDGLIAHGSRSLAGGLVFDYPFDFALYGDPRQVIRAPWPSAFAQGLALSLLCEMYEVTGQRSYLDAARDVFTGLIDPAEGMVRRDRDGWLWLEEYPHDGGGERIFNGHNFALFGVYDYWQVTGRGKDLLRAAITTSAHYASVVRQPGGVSLYSLDERNANPHYQPIHIAQLAQLSQITGEHWFHRMSVALEADGALARN